MRRRPSVTTQAGLPVATACLAAGGALLAVEGRVGVPLLCIGGLVTCWIVWKTWREDQLRKVVARLVIAASRRLSEYENASSPLTRGTVAEHFNHEAEWVQGALGHMEARLLLDTLRQPVAKCSADALDPAKPMLRGFRANLDDLYRRLPGLDLERGFKPRQWQDRL